MTNKKGFLGIALAVIVAALLMGATAYIGTKLGQQQQTFGSSFTPVQAQKTYEF